MITLISPAKTLDLSDSIFNQHTQPDFEREISDLVKIMKKKSVRDIKELMGVSDNLAELNRKRYLNFEDEFSVENSKQALLAFKGDVYTRIEVDEFSSEDFEFAQKHLRILSGLYGLLKPLDLIQPYRLEMGIKLKNSRAKDLYGYWGSKIAKAINEAKDDEIVVNLASQEYFKAVDQSKLKGRIIHPVFKEYKDGTYKIIGIFAKQARGMMTNEIIKSRINNPERLKTFRQEGYEYAENLSTENEWVFVR
ncbi:peroxide stress protein YaaA [Lunatibacter salilacus]|uniref:peroxide stress protein YaaA n=1 Tax=Lunatibacter salilacus TaxID=2483804 RepID=UPI00131CA5E5|nr:peroxide stress protein YaaA [Lunatibacter salilacus]